VALGPAMAPKVLLLIGPPLKALSAAVAEQS
jgi:hypothetical protein